MRCKRPWYADCVTMPIVEELWASKTPLDALRLTACVVQLGVAVLALLRGGRNPLVLPLGLLTLSLFAWNSCALMWSLSGRVQWHWLEMALSPTTSPILLHFVFVYVGRARQFRLVIVATYVVFGFFASYTAGAFVSAEIARFAGSPHWALCIVGLMSPVLVGSSWLLVHHRRQSRALEDRLQAALLVLALATAALFGVTELLADLGVSVPRLSPAGTGAGAAVLGFAVMRSSRFGRPLDAMIVVYAAGIAGLAVVAHVLVFLTFGANTTMLVVGTMSVTLGLLAAGRRFAGELAVRSARQAQLAALGRVSAQMAHDLRNPLAAVKGTVQFLQEERMNGRSIDDQSEFLTLMADQLDRMKATIEHYQVAVSLEPVVAPFRLDELIREVLALQRFADARVVVETNLAAGELELKGDRQLLSRALHNLVRNGCDAMPHGGTLTVSSAVEGRGRRLRSAVVTVEDTGSGMDPATRDRAFDSFFSTKSGGSGLGLPFVRRVAEAHGGDVSIFSVAGHGTVVRLSLAAPDEPGRRVGA